MRRWYVGLVYASQLWRVMRVPIGRVGGMRIYMQPPTRIETGHIPEAHRLALLEAADEAPGEVLATVLGPRERLRIALLACQLAKCAAHCGTATTGEYARAMADEAARTVDRIQDALTAAEART